VQCLLYLQEGLSFLRYLVLDHWQCAVVTKKLEELLRQILLYTELKEIRSATVVLEFFRNMALNHDSSDTGCSTQLFSMIDYSISLLSLHPDCKGVVLPGFGFLRHVSTDPDQASRLLHVVEPILPLFERHVDDADIAEVGVGFLVNLSQPDGNKMLLMTSLDTVFLLIERHRDTAPVVQCLLELLRNLSDHKGNKRLMTGVLDPVLMVWSRHGQDEIVFEHSVHFATHLASIPSSIPLLKATRLREMITTGIAYLGPAGTHSLDPDTIASATSLLQKLQ
jgi:hypothetical protein